MTDQPAESAVAPNRPRSLRVLLGYLLAAAVLALAGWGIYEIGRHHKLNFGVVDAGILYRSGQPDDRALHSYLQKYAIRTVINLRSPLKGEEDKRIDDEKAFCGDHGVTFINMPIQTKPSLEDVERFLQIVADPASRPVLVHCAGGKERSGVLVAVYRVMVDGWTLDRAQREMVDYGFHLDEQLNMWQRVEEVVATLKSRSAASAPVSSAPAASAPAKP